MDFSIKDRRQFYIFKGFYPMKTKKILYKLLMVLILVFSLTACDEKPISNWEAGRKAKELIPNLDMKYIGVEEENEKGYPILWSFQTKDKEKRKFYVKAHYLPDPKFGGNYTYVTDYYYNLAKEAFDAYKGNKDYIKLLEPLPSNSDPRIFVFYENLQELEKGCQEAEDFRKYVINKGQDNYLAMWSLYIDPKYESYSRETLSNALLDDSKNKKSMADLLYEDSLYKFSLIAIRQQFADQHFTQEEIENFVRKTDFAKFTIFTPDGQPHYWPDLFHNDPYGNELSVPTFFTVLSRQDYPSLEGDKNHYRFLGVNGKKYEFSSDFVDSYILKDNMEVDDLYKYIDTYYRSYYFEDGKRVEENFSLEEIAGLSFQFDWIDQPLKGEN